MIHKSSRGLVCSRWERLLIGSSILNRWFDWLLVLLFSFLILIFLIFNQHFDWFSDFCKCYLNIKLLNLVFWDRNFFLSYWIAAILLNYYKINFQKILLIHSLLFTLTQGNYVAIKQLLKSSVQLTRELLVELKEVSELQHQNVNSFVGACVDSPNICILTQYCNKGSLQDVLFNDDLKLDWMFQVSIASDIARVCSVPFSLLSFIHSIKFYRARS